MTSNTAIKYNVLRSKFSGPIKTQIDLQQNALSRGEVIAFRLPEDLCAENGYSGRIAVTIQSGSPETFDTGWSGDDASRFPARIKAAATALRDLNFTGTFEIYHSKGEFQIKAV